MRMRPILVALTHSTLGFYIVVFFIFFTIIINIPTWLGLNHKGAQDELKPNMQINSKMLSIFI